MLTLTLPLSFLFPVLSPSCIRLTCRYQNIWMYVTHELYDAVGDCENGGMCVNVAEVGLGLTTTSTDWWYLGG